MIRPYRIINAIELQQLQQLFNQRVHQWSEEYSICPLNIELILPPREYSLDSGSYIQSNAYTAAVIPLNYLDAVANWLFGIAHPSFHDSCESLSSLLFNHIFDLDYSNVTTLVEAPDWFYPGSTSLLLLINDGTTQLKCTLSPDFVYQLLPRCALTHQLGSLDEALAEQTVALTVALERFNIPLSHLMNLSPGDVIASDHPLTAPLKLIQNNYLLSDVELGQSLNYKSIIIKR